MYIYILYVYIYIHTVCIYIYICPSLINIPIIPLYIGLFLEASHHGSLRKGHPLTMYPRCHQLEQLGIVLRLRKKWEFDQQNLRHIFFSTYNRISSYLKYVYMYIYIHIQLQATSNVCILCIIYIYTHSLSYTCTCIPGVYDIHM